MDILTPKGQKTLADEQRVEAWIRSKGFSYAQTPKNKPADVDAILLNHKQQIVGICETKCRYGIDSMGFLSHFHGEWLITSEKIKKGLMLSSMLRAPLYCFLFLPDSNEITFVKVSDCDGKVIADMREEETKTQATVNGGTAVRMNCFIRLDQPFYQLENK